MTILKKVFCFCIGLYMFAGLSAAQAQYAPGPDTAPKFHSGQHIYSQLDLTDEQKKQLEANKQQHRAKMEGLHQAMKTEKQALEGELMQAQLNMARINDIHNQIKALQSQIEDDRLSSILAVRTILTPEEFSKLLSLMHKHKQGRD